jgi:hypothetical protein
VVFVEVGHMNIDNDINSMYPNTIREKFPANKWHWDYNPSRQRWETYRQPMDWPFGLYGWLLTTFGETGDDWDYLGGWIYIYRKDYLMLFELRWS